MQEKIPQGSKEEINDEPKIHLAMELGEEQLYGLLNALIDIVGENEEHYMAPVLDKLGDVVLAHEQSILYLIGAE
jgi:hypothetical protein